MSASLDLVAGQPADVRLEYFEADSRRGDPLGLARCRTRASRSRRRSTVARASDVVVFAGGLNGDVEGEEMKVSYPGFAGGDRTDIGLPAPQEKLLRALHATGKPVVLVLMTGSAIAVNWAQPNLPAIVLAWYPGQQGGNAIADVLFGDANPSGRLPVTFYRSVEQLPAFADYAMSGRTYRYFYGEPLYAFGHGLSYARFSYSDLRLERSEVGIAEPIELSVTVRNVGPVGGAEVAQLYARHVSPRLAQPRLQLRGFERVFLRPGEERRLAFRWTPQEAFAHYDTEKRAFAVERGEYEVQAGASSRDIRQAVRVRVR